MGLALLANLTAYDMGYIPGGQLVRAHRRHAGRDARARAPRRAFLQLVRHALGEAAAAGLRLGGGQRQSRGPPADAARPACWRCRTTRSSACGGSRAWPTRCARSAMRSAAPRRRRSLRLQQELETAYDSRPATVESFRRWLDRLAKGTTDVAAHLAPALAARDDAAAAGDAAFWTDAMQRQLDAMREELAGPRAVERSPARAGGTGRVPPHARHPDAARSGRARARLAPRHRQPSGTGGRVGAGAARGSTSSPRRLRKPAAPPPRAHRGDRAPGAALRRAVPHGIWPAVRRVAAPAGHRLQRRRAPARRELLRPARIGGAVRSFVAIAQGPLPQENWFALGRLLTGAGGQRVLVSWSGSMFEYLMPQLVMPTYDGTLLDQTCRAAVQRQIAYGRQRGVPWGISECGYNAFDAALNYQYRAFGVPGIGLKRGLAEDLVVAPYASALALMIAPDEACQNLQRLAAEGPRRPVRAVRGDRLHAVAPAARAGERGRALVHGAPPGHDPARGGAGAARTARCRGASRRTRGSRRRCCCCRNASPRSPRSSRIPRELSERRDVAAGPEAPVRILVSAEHAGAGSCSCCPTAAIT